jgi:hypothetical protein
MDNENYQVSTLIYEKLAAIMADVPAIKKVKSNGDLPYKFRGIDDVYNTLHPLFVLHQVFTTSEIMNKSRDVWTNKNGTIMIEYSLQVKYRFIAVDGSFVETQTMGQAMDSSDKASNKAMSMAHKAAILQIFMIPTVDLEDPDSTTPEPQAHGYAQQPIQYPQYEQPLQYHRPAAAAQNNGYRQQAPMAPPAQQQGYHGNGGGQQADRPASPKSIAYLRDLTGRPQISREDAMQIDQIISAGGLMSAHCSKLIDSLNAVIKGNMPSVFQVPDQQFQQPFDGYASQPAGASYSVDDCPF